VIFLPHFGPGNRAPRLQSADQNARTIWPQQQGFGRRISVTTASALELTELQRHKPIVFEGIQESKQLRQFLPIFHFSQDI
jgi:hypothetical protein